MGSFCLPVMEGTKQIQPGRTHCICPCQIIRSAFSVTAAERKKLMNGTQDLSSVQSSNHRLEYKPFAGIGAHPRECIPQVLLKLYISKSTMGSMLSVASRSAQMTGRSWV